MNVDVRVARTSVTEIKTPLLVVNLFEGVERPQCRIVRSASAGAVTACTVTLPLRPGQKASLRVAADDAAGRTLRQTVIRSFSVRPHS